MKQEKENPKIPKIKYIHIVRENKMKPREEKIKFLRTFIENNRDKKHMIFNLGSDVINLNLKDLSVKFIHDEAELAEEIISSECRVIVW